MVSEPMYKKIYDDLLGGIKEGKYPPGCRLPSEKELIDMYKVSRITVKKALEILAYRGCILRKPGRGSFVVFENNLEKALQSGDIMREEELSGQNETVRSSERVIGVIFDSFSVSFGFDLIRGIEYECRKRGLLMFFRCTYGSKEAENCAIHDMIQVGARGIILMCSQGEVYNETILELYMDKYPLILLDREMAGISLPVVATDNYKASCDLVTKLIEAGHKKICFVSHLSLNITTVKERFNGYRDTMLSNRLSVDGSTWIADIDIFQNGEKSCREAGKSSSELADYIQKNTDIKAYYAVNHEMGMHIFQILKSLGIEKEKTIAYFNGLEANVDPLPVFPHVMQDQYQMGAEAVRLLSHRLKGDTVSGRENIPYSIVMPKTGF